MAEDDNQRSKSPPDRGRPYDAFSSPTQMVESQASMDEEAQRRAGEPPRTYRQLREAHDWIRIEKEAAANATGSRPALELPRSSGETYRALEESHRSVETPPPARAVERQAVRPLSRADVIAKWASAPPDQEVELSPEEREAVSRNEVGAHRAVAIRSAYDAIDRERHERDRRAQLGLPERGPNSDAAGRPTPTLAEIAARRNANAVGPAGNVQNQPTEPRRTASLAQIQEMARQAGGAPYSTPDRSAEGGHQYYLARRAEQQRPVRGSEREMTGGTARGARAAAEGRREQTEAARRQQNAEAHRETSDRPSGVGPGENSRTHGGRDGR